MKSAHETIDRFQLFKNTFRREFIVLDGNHSAYCAQLTHYENKSERKINMWAASPHFKRRITHAFIVCGNSDTNSSQFVRLLKIRWTSTICSSCVGSNKLCCLKLCTVLEPVMRIHKMDIEIRYRYTLIKNMDIFSFEFWIQSVMFRIHINIWNQSNLLFDKNYLFLKQKYQNWHSQL